MHSVPRRCLSALAVALWLSGAVSPALAQSPFLAQAQERFRAKDYPGALAELKKAEKAGTMGADEWNLLGSIRLRQRQFAPARDSFRRAVRADPTFFAAQFNLGEADFRERNYAAARTSFEQLLESATTASERDLARYKIALTYVKERRLAEAQRAIEELKAADSGSYVYAQAALAYEKRDGTEAARWLTRAPVGNRAAQAKIFADSFETMGLSTDPRAAATLTTKESSPENSLDRWTLDGLATGPAPAPGAPRNEPPANLANASEPTARALRDLPPTVFNPSVPTATLVPGAAASRPAPAKTVEIKAAAPAPSQAFLDAFLLAAKAYQKRDYAVALEALDRAEALQPGQADAANLRGLIHFKRRELAQAESLFREAIRLDPSLWTAKLNLADIPFDFRNFTLARERFERLYTETDATIQPREAEFVQFKIFLTLLLEGKELAARNFMNRFGFSGRTPARYYAQAALNFHSGDFDRAVAWMQSARREFPAEVDALFAESLYRVGWLTENVTAPSLVPEPIRAGGDGPTSAVAEAGNADSALPSGAIQPLPEKRAPTPAPTPALTPPALAEATPPETVERKAPTTLSLGPVNTQPRDRVGAWLLGLALGIMLLFLYWLHRLRRAQANSLPSQSR